MPAGNVPLKRSDKRVAWRLQHRPAVLAVLTGEDERFAAAYEWLRASLAHLQRRRHPVPAVEARFPELRERSIREATAYLLGCAQRMDEQVPPSRGEKRRLALRHAEFTAARTPLERLWRAQGWVLSSAHALSRYPACLPLRQDVLAGAARWLAARAEAIDRGENLN